MHNISLLLLLKLIIRLTIIVIINSGLYNTYYHIKIIISSRPINIINRLLQQQ